MKNLLILLLIGFISVEAQKIKYGNFSPQLKADLKDTTGRIVSDSIRQDNWVAWDYLDNIVQDRINTSTENLYDYQDPTVPGNLQMQTRWAHYLHERFYNQSINYYVTPYDVSGSVAYQNTRRPIPQYIYLLKTLHELTGRDKYWYELLNLVEETLDSCEIVNHNVTGGRSTLSINTDDGSSWPYADMHFYDAIYYIYTQSPTLYANYLTKVRDFIDVVYSYITKSDITGWGYGYRWDNVAAANSRININFPIMKFWARMKAAGVTTTDITTTAVYDTLLDSTYTFISTGWLKTVVAGDTVGGWEERPGDASISEEYNSAAVYLFEIAEILNDYSWTAGLLDSMQYVYNYYTSESQNYDRKTQEHNLRIAALMKFAEDNSLTSFDASHTDAWVASILYPGAFIGDTWQSGNLVGVIRLAVNRLHRDLSVLLEFFPSDSYTEGYILPCVAKQTTSEWGANETLFNLYDGSVVIQKNWLGLVRGNPSYIAGFKTNDTSPNCADTSTFTLSTDKVLGWTYPAQANSKTYVVSNRLSTPFFMVVPSVADSLYFEVPDTSTITGDSLYIFYYDQASQLQHVLAFSVAVGDSISGINGSLGFFGGTVRAKGSTDDQYGIGIICNNTNMSFIKKSNSLYGRQIFWSRTLADSAIFFQVNHRLPGLLMESAGDFTYPDRIIVDILEAAQRYWDYGINTIGILEDKTQ